MSTESTESILAYLPQTASDDLASLAGNSDKLDTISDSVSQSTPGIGLSGIAEKVSNDAGIPVRAAERILWTVWNLRNLKNRLRLDTERLMRMISAVLEDQSGGAASEDLKTWNAAADRISAFVDRLTDTNPLVISRKAQLLGLAHQNVFADARLVSDVRPVFDAAGDKVVESFVMQTLLIDYFDGDQSRRIEFALDAADVSQLRRLLERAERKALALTRDLSRLKWPTTILGKDSPTKREHTGQED
jgi:hypothetical protein